MFRTKKRENVSMKFEHGIKKKGLVKRERKVYKFRQARINSLPKCYVQNKKERECQYEVWTWIKKKKKIREKIKKGI